MSKNIRAILWDYDGTLVDSRKKNFNVIRKIMQAVTGKEAERIPALRTMESYHSANTQSANWRDLYQRVFGLTPEETDRAGLLWSEYQSKDDTPTPFYYGISEVLKELDRLPHGIVSQNSRAAILESLGANGLAAYFHSVIGYEEVALDRQKPLPDGLLKCMREIIDSAPGYIFYIGDHETDARCAANADAVLEKQGIPLSVRSIGAFYGTDADDSKWQIRPHYQAHSPDDIIQIIHAHNDRIT